MQPSVQDVLKPLIYADIFDYPLTLTEIYHFLEIPTTLEIVQNLLHQAITEQRIISINNFFCLANRAHLVAKRQERWHLAQTLWPQAHHYGRWLASLPFVVMVAVTGSLAVNNPRSSQDDIDYLIVTRPGRLWLCRAWIIMWVRYGRCRGVELCPNYILTENVLHFTDHNLYAARELLQMVPLYGQSTYQTMRALNHWAVNFLPHGQKLNLDQLSDQLSPTQQWSKQWGEFALGGGLGNFIEKILQKIQISKHTRLAAKYGATDKVTFTTDECKGHYNSHGNKTMQIYQQHLQDYHNENGITRKNG